MKTDAVGSNNQTPLVSIITPVLNRADSIEGCLASVAKQSYRPIEHIVVDGGSSDGTVKLIEQHQPGDVAYQWISERDEGMYDAINKGIALARGEVVAYLNSDDLYFPWSVEVAVRGLRHSVDIIFGDLGVLQVRRGSRPPTFYLQFYPEFNLRYYSFVGSIAQPTAFWRRTISERIGGFDTSYGLIADCDFWLRAALDGARMRHVDEVMAVQVEHPFTLRATQPRRLDDEFHRLRTRMTKTMRPPSSPRREALKKSVRWRFRQLEFFYASKQRRPNKWPRFIEAIRTHGLDMRLRALRMLAPARWRGDASLLGDVSRLDELMRTGPSA
jgi:glycosyltransferase involved in cell wall biosynthesis